MDNIHLQSEQNVLNQSRDNLMWIANQTERLVIEIDKDYSLFVNKVNKCQKGIKVSINVVETFIEILKFDFSAKLEGVRQINSYKRNSQAYDMTCDDDSADIVVYIKAISETEEKIYNLNSGYTDYVRCIMWFRMLLDDHAQRLMRQFKAASDGYVDDINFKISMLDIEPLNKIHWPVRTPPIDAKIKQEDRSITNVNATKNNNREDPSTVNINTKVGNITTHEDLKNGTNKVEPNITKTEVNRKSMKNAIGISIGVVAAVIILVAAGVFIYHKKIGFK